jgi:aminoglycoside phosphotransferase (APT) family kinase protein
MSQGKVIVAPRVRDLDELSRDLGVWLRARMPEAKDLSLANFDYPHGAGRSHETILFDATWTEGGEARSQGMVVRIKPSDHIYYPDDLFDEQIRIMQVLREQGRVKVAKIFWREDDPEVLGNAFFVMEKKKGRVAVTTPPYATEGWVAEATPAQRRKFWENGVRQLAATQLTPLDTIQFLAGPGGLSGFEQEWDKYVRFLEWVSEERRWPALDRALADLKERWPANRPEGLVWGDSRIGNMMFDDDMNVIAVMDWEQPSLGGALHDLAWWVYMDRMNHGERPDRPHLEGMGTSEETVALWEEVCGKSAADLDWYIEFTGLKTALLSIRTCSFMDMPQPTDDVLTQMLQRSRG